MSIWSQFLNASVQMDFSEEEKSDQSTEQLNERQCHRVINEQCCFFWNTHFGDSVSKGRPETGVIQEWLIKIIVVRFPGEDKLWRPRLSFLERQQRSTVLGLYKVTHSGVN